MDFRPGPLVYRDRCKYVYIIIYKESVLYTYVLKMHTEI